MDALQLSFYKQRDIEKLFAAAVYAYPLYSVQLCGWLSPDILLDEKIRQFWTACLTRLDLGMADDDATTVVIQAAIEMGIHVDLNKWTNDLPMTPMPQAFAAEISRRVYIANTAQLNNRLALAIGQQDDALITQIVDEMKAQTRKSVSSVPGAEEISEKFISMLNLTNRNIRTFIPNIDSTIGGLERQTLTVLAARPSMGKSALAGQISQNAALDRKKVLYANLEMSNTNLWSRSACALAGTTWRDVRAERVDVATLARIETESRGLAERLNGYFYSIDTRLKTDELWRLCAEHRPDLVIADHLACFKDEHRSEIIRLGSICQACKDIAKAFNCAFLLVAQLSRKTEDRPDHRPQLADLRDSGEIEQIADMVLMMYRDDYYNPLPGSKVSSTELTVKKFRDGPANILINLVFNPAREWFEPRGA